MTICKNFCIIVAILLFVLGAVFAKQKNPIDAPIACIEKAIKAGRNNIVVPPGTYRVTPKNDVYLSLKDMKEVTIDFTGVEFIGTTQCPHDRD